MTLGSQCESKTGSALVWVPNGRSLVMRPRSQQLEVVRAEQTVPQFDEGSSSESR